MEENKGMEKRSVKVQDALAVYNTLKGLKIAKLDREGQFAVLRAARALKAVATGFEDFAKDAQERLKPEGFDKVVEKSQRFDTLTDDEKRAVNAAAAAYQRDVDECVRPELESVKEVDGFAPLSEDTVAAIASSNEQLDVQTLMLIEDVCG